MKQRKVSMLAKHPGRVSAAAMMMALLGAAPAGAKEFAVSLEGGWYDMSGARQSAKAVFDSSGGPTFGGTLRLSFGRGAWFAGAGSRYFSREGERVFVADKNSQVFRLGHPLTARVIPVYALVGYCLRSDKRLVPYVAVGPGYTTFRERSVVAEIEEKHEKTILSFHAAAGAEYGQGTVRFGAEVFYTAAPDSLGFGGVSKVYGEKDVGGFSFLAKIVFVP
jgi:Outer membrane protein beta-barrel domain